VGAASAGTGIIDKVLIKETTATNQTINPEFVLFILNLLPYLSITNQSRST